MLMNKTRIIGFTTVTAAGISVLLNLLLIPLFHWYGAVIAFDVSFILLGTALAAMGLKRSSIVLEWKRLSCLAGLLMCLLMALFILHEFSVIQFSVIAVLGVILGILLLLHFGFFHDDEEALVRRLVVRLR